VAGRLIGDAYVAILPNTDTFRTLADAQIRRELGTLHPDIRIGADTAPATAQVAKLAALIKAQKFGNIQLGLDTSDALMSVAGLNTALGVLRDRAENIPVSTDDSRALASIFSISVQADKLAEQLGDVEVDADITPILAKYYTLEDKTSQLEAALSHLDANMDSDAAIEKLATLRADADQLNMRLSTMVAGVDDAQALSKLVALQVSVSALAKQMYNMPMDADTLPVEAKLLGVRAQLDAIDAKALDTGIGSPGNLGSVALASAITSFETMEDRLQAVDTYLKQTGDIGTQSFGALNTAIQDASAEFSRLKTEGIGAGNVTDVKNLDSVIKQLGQDTGLTANEANTAYHGFGLLGRAIAAIRNTKIPLFGGALDAIGAPTFIADATGIHMLVEGIVELTAVWGPALLGLTAFGLLAVQTGKKIYEQWTNMNTVADATGAKFAGLKSGMQDLENAVKPEVMQLFGDYLTTASGGASHFTDMMQEMGNGLDDVGAKIALWFDSDTTSKFLEHAASDAGGLADAFLQLGRIIGTLLQAVPGYAEMLLKLGDGFLTLVADAVSGLEPVIALFLKLHGAIFYLGLATTAVLTFGRAFAALTIAKSGLEVFGTAASAWAADFTSDNEKVAAEAGNTGSKLSKWAGGLGSLFGGLIGTVGKWSSSTVSSLRTVGPAATGISGLEGALSHLPGVTRAVSTDMMEIEGEMVTMPAAAGEAAGGLEVFGAAIDTLPLVGIIAGVTALAAGIGFLVYNSLKSTTPEVVQFNAQMQKLVLSSNIVDVQGNIATAIKDTAAEMAKTADAIPGLTQKYNSLAKAGQNTLDIHNTGQEIQEIEQAVVAYQNQIVKLGQQSDTSATRTGPLVKQFGSLQAVMTLVSLAGVNQNAVVKDSAKQWALDQQKIEATAASYGFMGQQSGAAAGQLNALNISAGGNMKAVQSLTTAESQWITLVTGGIDGFATFEQGQATLAGTLSGKVTPAVVTSTTASDKATNSLTKLAKGGTDVTSSLSKTASTTKAAATSADTMSVTLGKITEKFSLAGASMNGTSTASLAVQQAFASQLSTGVSLYGNLQTLAAASGNTAAAQQQLATGGKAILATLLPFVAGSKEGTAELSSLAQLMGGPATDNFQVLAKWVGNVKGAEDKLNTSQTNLTISASSLSTASKNLGNAIITDVTNMEAAKVVTATLGGAVDGLYDAATQARGQVTKLAVSSAGEYLTAMENAGVSTTTATQYLNTYLKTLRYGPAAIKAIDSQMGDSATAWDKYDAAVTGNTAAAKVNAKATQANQNAFYAMPGMLATTSRGYLDLWDSITRQDRSMVRSGQDALGAKGEFVDFAVNALDLTTAKADDLWTKLGQQDLDVTGAKAQSAKKSFVDFAENSLKLSSTEANTLWNELAMQNLDMIVTKGDNARKSFIDLAKNGLGLTTSSADQLWNTLEHQYLDTVASKAGETRVAFEKTATQFGLTKGAADKLWTSLHTLAADSPYPVNVVETLSGKGSISAAVTAQRITLSSAGLATQAAEGVGVLAPGHAAGWQVPAGGTPSGQDGRLAVLAPGELVIPTSHAATFGAAAKRAGVPGFDAGGFPAGASAAAGAAATGISAAETGAVQFTQDAMGKFAQAISSAVTSAQEGSNWSGTVPGGAGNLLLIARYLMANGLNKAAAAGVAATISGESGGNPESVGCLTLDNKILTQRGWLTHEQVQAGDKTIGYNLETGKSEWTLVKRVMLYRSQPVVRMSKRGFSVTGTYSHRWLTEQGYRTELPRNESGNRRRVTTWKPARLTPFENLKLSRDRIVLAAEADLGAELPITQNEASLLGWIAGEGTVRCDGGRRTVEIIFYQSKPENFARIETALSEADYTVGVRDGARDGYYGSHDTRVYRLRGKYVRELSARIDGLNPKRDADKLVLRMSPAQRSAWLEAMWLADGNQSHKRANPAHEPLIQYSQNPVVNPEISNAIELAVYLSGKRPGIYERTRDSGSVERCITETQPYIGGLGNGALAEDAGIADVWCVETGLGSWTAKGGDAKTEVTGAFLTGNSGGFGLKSPYRMDR
jgi:hypothetical protein